MYQRDILHLLTSERVPGLAPPLPDADVVLAKATLSAARRLGLTNRDLAAVLGTSEASVSRLAGDRALRLLQQPTRCP